MMKIYLLLSAFVFPNIFCLKNTSFQSLTNPKGNTIKERFGTPQHFERDKIANQTFAYYLRNLTLKPNKSKVLYYNGQEKEAQVHEAVVQIDVGKKDLQQCADAVMRLRAEYLFKQKRYADIHFNFTNGFNATYLKWANGYRIKVNGNQCSWTKSADSSYSYETFRKYLDIVFTYAGTLSLSKELTPRAWKQMQIGDVFIYGGSPGHAVIVVDMCHEPKSGKKLFMLAQSYMPAQDIHVLKNENNPAISPWYELNENIDIQTPEWPFTQNQLKHFK